MDMTACYWRCRTCGAEGVFVLDLDARDFFDRMVAERVRSHAELAPSCTQPNLWLEASGPHIWLVKGDQK